MAITTNPAYKSIWTGEQVDEAVGIANQALPLNAIVQTTGPNTNKVMSQGATTNALNQKASQTDISNAIISHNINTSAHPYILEQVEANTDLINNKPNALNSFSNSQTDCYSANYANGAFAPLTFVSNLYANKIDSSSATLINNKPAVSPNNVLTVANSVNTDYDWNSPNFTFIRTLENPITLSASNSFAFDLAFKINRNATISWGAKMKVSNDNGVTWTYISTNQAYGAVAYETGIGNTETLIIYSDALTETTEYPIGDLLGIEIYKKQLSATPLTTDVYCGVEVDGADIYSFAQFNFNNVSINTNQIEDGAVTLPKLEVGIQNTINSVAGKQNLMRFISLPTPDASLVGKIYQFIGATTQNFIRGYWYQCVDNAGVYSWQQINVQPNTDISGKQDINLYGTIDPTTATIGMVGQLYFNTDMHKIWECTDVTGEVYNWENITPSIQFDTMPDATLYNGQVIQYVGTTTTNYINGLFYKSNGTSWANIDTTNITNKAEKQIVGEYVLLSTLWVNKSQTLTIQGKTSSLNAIVSASQTGSSEDVLANQTALGNANIYQVIDNGNSLTFVCETVPTVDLNILVTVGG